MSDNVNTCQKVRKITLYIHNTGVQVKYVILPVTTIPDNMLHKF